MKREDPRSLLRRPLVVAPMGGGPSTPGLVTAAAEAGALGFLAGAYKGADALAADIAAVRAGTSEAFGVNLFVPGSPATDREALGDYVAALARDAAALGCEPGDPVWDDDGWEEKLAAVLAAAPPLVSFTFGCPDRAVIEAFQATGTLVAVTVTTVEEAGVAAARQVDALCSQGLEAGAHRGSFGNDDRPGQDVPLLDLVTAVGEATGLPQFAAGGISGPDGVRAVLRAGAVAAQCGTAFLRCPESGASPLHKAALADPRHTATTITRGFSGRRARGIVNRFILDHPSAPAAYPEINSVTRPLRAAAARAGDVDRMSLWAGVGFASASDRPAGEIVEMLGAGAAQ